MKYKMCAIKEYVHCNISKVNTWIHSFIKDLNKLKLHIYVIYIWSLCPYK